MLNLTGEEEPSTLTHTHKDTTFYSYWEESIKLSSPFWHYLVTVLILTGGWWPGALMRPQVLSGPAMGAGLWLEWHTRHKTHNVDSDWPQPCPEPSGAFKRKNWKLSHLIYTHQSHYTLYSFVLNKVSWSYFQSVRNVWFFKLFDKFTWCVCLCSKYINCSLILISFALAKSLETKWIFKHTYETLHL